MLKIITNEQADKIKKYLTNDVFNHIRDNITPNSIPKFKRHEAYLDLATIFTEQAAIFEHKASLQTRRLSDIESDIGKNQ